MGHTLRGEHAGEIEKGKETKNLNVVDVITVEERI
jgi:hypothetical protein